MPRTQGMLRETHLKYHLSTGSMLTPSQMTKYAELRGYGGGGHKRHRPLRPRRHLQGGAAAFTSLPILTIVRAGDILIDRKSSREYRNSASDGRS